MDSSIGKDTANSSGSEPISSKEINIHSADSLHSASQNGFDASKAATGETGKETAGDFNLHKEINTNGEETDGDNISQANGEMFSPDSSDMVTVICKTEVGKLSEDCDQADKDGGDGYDTHSDSIETLEDESPHDDGQILTQSMLQQICLTSSTSSQEALQDRSQPSSSQLDEQTKDSGDEQFLEGPSTSADSGVFPPVNRPESLSLPRPLQYFERNRSTSEPQKAGNVKGESSAGHQRTRSEALDIHNAVKVRGDLGCGDDLMSRSLPQGTLVRKGDMVEFVADDLTGIIKRSSPASRADSSSMGSRRSSQRSIASTSSATSTSVTSGVSRSPSSLLTQSPDAAPPIDPGAVMELEVSARRVADSVDLMMGNLRNNLHKMSAITVGCTEAYKTSVDITCDSVDSSIKSMYALMAKCEELSGIMEPVYEIGGQIKEIKRLLDRFEAQLSEKP